MGAVKKVVKVTLKTTLPVTGLVGGMKLADRLTSPLALRALEYVGVLKFIPPGIQNLAVDVSRGLHAVGGFALGHGAADWLGKKIGG